MIQNTMTCELFNDRLMAYLEHEADDVTVAAVERHAVTCAECGALLADLRKLRIDSANLPERTPSRDLWSSIAARIEAPVFPIGTRVQETPQPMTRRWFRGAVAAAALVAAAGIGYVAAGRGPISVVDRFPVSGDTQFVSTPAESASSAPIQQVVERRDLVPPPIARAATPGGTPVVTVSRSSEVQRAVAGLTADYDREIARLRALIEQRRNQLDPTTVAIIEKNLMVIDTAIADSKRAIARDPASRFLIESLNQSLQTKVELMRTAALLPSRT